MDSLTLGALKIELKQETNTTVMHFKGRSEIRDPNVTLKPYFKNIADQVQGELRLDFTGLEYMNSSIVSSLLMFIKELNNQAVVTNLFYKKDLKWQLASFKALETISKTLEYISVSGH